MNTYIYALTDPSGEIRYVGKSDNPTTRHKTHLNRAERTHKGYWIRSLKVLGVEPGLLILDGVPRVEWSFWEQHWIQLLRGWGFNLVNGDNGGLGSGRLPDHVKDKIRATLTGRTSPQHWRQVHCYDARTGLYARSFESVRLAEEVTGCSHANISKACKEHRTAGGLAWSYERVIKLDRPNYVEGKHKKSTYTREAHSAYMKLLWAARKAAAANDSDYFVDAEVE